MPLITDLSYQAFCFGPNLVHSKFYWNQFLVRCILLPTNDRMTPWISDLCFMRFISFSFIEIFVARSINKTGGLLCFCVLGATSLCKRGFSTNFNPPAVSMLFSPCWLSIAFFFWDNPSQWNFFRNLLWLDLIRSTQSRRIQYMSFSRFQRRAVKKYTSSRFSLISEAEGHWRIFCWPLHRRWRLWTM